MYVYLLIILVAAGVGLYFFAPVDEMYSRAKNTIEQNEVMRVRVGEMYETVKSKTGEIVEGVEQMNTDMLERAEEILPEAGAVNTEDAEVSEDSEETITEEPKETTAEERE